MPAGGFVKKNEKGTGLRAAPRFTEDEKTVLIALVGEFKHIIECKKTDVASIAKKKNETWKEIAKRFNSNHGITRRDHVQLKKCWNNLKQKWKEEAARKKRERHKTGGGSAPSAMAPVYELVGSIASHMATRVENAFDSDATGYQPPVASLPVVRLLQPMTDSRNEADFDCQDDLWQGANPVEPSQLPTGTDADEDSRCTSIAQPDAEANISVEGCANSHQATGAAGSSTPAATVAAETYRTPRGRMAVLEKTLAAENAFRAELQKEEHAIRIRLMQEDHDYKMREREDRRNFENQVRDLELSKLKSELEKQELEIDILKIEKELKKEQLRRLQCNVPRL
ncbi:hypothetical protein HPB51_004794 [Rhipicephalus microplus]|uniref:Regulatory protein zeste n=1 Tax=Rhipicephalus microplus TaxID=6941 RepID=A0A9J6E6U5_RHIMP|nr:hypothetical protein HPB51_004794 [Rhipicephalus microplus]